MSIYKTIEEASQAAIKLGINSKAEYKTRYKEDPKLPANPDNKYKAEWDAFGRWYGLLDNVKPVFYETIEEASQAAIKLGIKNFREYKTRYKEDPKLRTNPQNLYKAEWDTFGRWYGFLGHVKPDFYETIEEASQAAIKLGINTKAEYHTRYKEDPKLRTSPNDIYKTEWDAFGRWYGFLGHVKPDFYETIEEASQAAIKLGIKSGTEYKKCCQKDPKLPANPDNKYKAEWDAFGRWYGFLNNVEPDFYETIEEASQAAIKLGIKSGNKYNTRYQKDPKLPAHPDKKYKAEWDAFGRWHGFLNKVIFKPGFYETIEEASQAAIKLGSNTMAEYKTHYKEDPKLPANPNRIYKTEWDAFGSWYGFLGHVKPDFYKTIEEASQATIKLGIKGNREYKTRYKEDPKLPANPDDKYKTEWDAFGRWYGFLDNVKPDFYKTIEEASQAAINLGIKSGTEYKKRYQEDPRLSASPSVLYKAEWDAFGRWYGFLETTKPFFRADICQEYSAWGEIYDSFIKNVQRGINLRRRTCIGFIFKFIMPNNYPERPEAFLLKTTKINNQDYETFLNYFAEENKTNFHSTVLEFLDYCLSKLCTLEDENEVVISPDYCNPLKRFQSPLLEIQAPVLSESDKPVLAYTYVVAAREWIVTQAAKSFGDLTHLHNLQESDWFDVDPSLIDEKDTDCVYRYVEKGSRKVGDTGVHNGKVCQMWSPVRFFSLFTLLSIPARGQQILWCDSGEADKKIPELVDGKIEWRTNLGLLAGLTKKQGFIKAYPDNELGLHFTTNKTAAHEGGYDIPWTPNNFANWIIKLRNWQSKYNPIAEPTKWTEITLPRPVGSKILEQRGSNCFLFRQPNDFKPYLPVIYSKILAYVLHQIEASDNPLTTQINDMGNARSYKTEYTPHSMRVSLITAFVVDAKVPIHIVQKLVGHARLVMTIYYTKIGHAEMRDELNAANKRALSSAPARIQQQIRNKKFEEVKDSLVANDSLVFNNIKSDHPTSAFSFTDIGICPMGGGKCELGGEVENDAVKHKKYLPVSAGHLGEKNCIRCRFFMTSPAFLGGLTAVFNEIALKQHYTKQKEKDLLIHIQSLEDEQYDCEKKASVFTKSMDLDKANSNLEVIAKETSMYATDSVYLARLVSQCIALLNESIKSDAATENMLVANTAATNIEWSLDETNSEFHQLSTVCENATIYALADASNATARRSQLIDKMAYQNGIEPLMCMLTPEQQLAVGNQMSELLKSRFKTWDKVEKLMSSEIYLDDLKDGDQLTPLREEVKNILLRDNVKLSFKETVLEGL